MKAFDEITLKGVELVTETPNSVTVRILHWEDLTEEDYRVLRRLFPNTYGAIESALRRELILARIED